MESSTLVCRDRPVSNRFPSIVDGFGQAAQSIVFFRPVENSLSHHTFLGKAFHRKFDFLAQVYAVIKADTQRDGESGKISSVIVGAPHGPPVTVLLSHKKYSELSARVRVWEMGEAGYHVSEEMLLNLFNASCVVWCVRYKVGRWGDKNTRLSTLSLKWGMFVRAL